MRNQGDENDISRLNGKLIVACENIDAQQDTIDAQQGRYYRCAARHHQCSTGNHRYPARKDSDRQKQAEKTQEIERENVGGAVEAARGERKDAPSNKKIERPKGGSSSTHRNHLPPAQLTVLL